MVTLRGVPEQPRVSPRSYTHLVRQLAFRLPTQSFACVAVEQHKCWLRALKNREPSCSWMAGGLPGGAPFHRGGAGQAAGLP